MSAVDALHAMDWSLQRTDRAVVVWEPSWRLGEGQENSQEDCKEDSEEDSEEGCKEDSDKDGDQENRQEKGCG